MAEADGRIVSIVSETSGRADLDTNGDGAADEPAALGALGVTDRELETLADLYETGQSLWRVPATHFSPRDPNYPVTPNGPPPELDEPEEDDEDEDPCDEEGSTIECQNQVLGEDVAVSGTPFTLHYRSDRVRGRAVRSSLNIMLSKDTIPSTLLGIELEVSIAGRRFRESFPAAPNQQTRFTWDGKDAYGRTLQGLHPVTVEIGYVYEGIVQLPDALDQSFGRTSGMPMLPAQAARQEVTLWQTFEKRIGHWLAREQGLGAWTLSTHHAYDPTGRILHLGTGETRNGRNLNTVMSAFAGQGSSLPNGGDGGPALLARFNSPNQLATAPDGSVYVLDESDRVVRKIGADGIISTVAGTRGGSQSTGCDGGPATSAWFVYPTGLAVGPDGSVFIADRDGHTVCLVTPDGMIQRLAGTGAAGFNGDGGPAAQAHLSFPSAVAVAPDGTVFIADRNNNRIRRIGTDGIIATVAGDGSSTPSGPDDGGPALLASLNSPQALALGADGSIYVAFFSRIRRIGPDGIITTVTGNPGSPGFSGDGGPATSAKVSFPRGLTVDRDGVLCFSDSGNHRLRRVGTDGIINTVAGSGPTGFPGPELGGDGGPSTAAGMPQPIGVAALPDRTFYVVNVGIPNVRKISPPLPGFSTGEIVIASDEGSLLYVFDSSGRHLRTNHVLTGAVVQEFEYDPAGLLKEIRDSDGNVTTIERDGNGNPSAIRAPFGQVTSLRLDANGYVSTIANPMGETHQFTYSSDGLMLGMRTPRQHEFTFAYDELGRLVRDDDPANGFQTLTRSGSVDGFEVVRGTALGRSTTYGVDLLSDGNRRWRNTLADGTVNEALFETNGARTSTLADGTIDKRVDGPDPRFGMDSPILSERTTTLPSGLTSTVITSRVVELATPSDPLSLVTQIETSVANGRTFTNVFDAASRRFTLASPESRQAVSTIDLQGRLIDSQVMGLEATALTYDPRGRLATVSQGTGADQRVFTLGYHPTSGFLETVTDPLGRVTGYLHDLAGRVISQTLPGGRTIGFNYDSDGNLTSLTPPGRTAHSLDYTPVNLASEYDPPDIGGNDLTTYSYSLDRDLELVTRPDGQTIDLVYATASGRLNSIVTPNGTTTYGYHPTTGKLTSVAAPGNQSLTYAYDGSLLLSEAWSGDLFGSVARTYDTSFRLTSLSVNDAAPVAFTYDKDDLLTVAGSETLARHGAHGLIIGTTLGLVADTWGYNGFGDLASYGASQNGAQIFATTFTRDKLGRIETKTETVDATKDTYAYHYDPVGRLESVDKNAIEISRYTYDVNGNRESYVGQLGEVSDAETTYDAQDRLTSYGNAIYTYTANGELLTKTVGSAITSYTYDVFGNLRTVELLDGTDIEYVIDGRNRRVGKKVNGTLVQGFLYQDQLEPIAELDGAGNVVSRFVYGSKENVPDYFTKGGATYRIISDHLGSPRLVVDSSTGAIAQRLDYDEFGNVITDTNPGFQPFGFAGGLYDRDTGLVRFGARDYDPETGRWTARDPILFAGGDPNLYGYVFGDPVNFIDPPGLFAMINASSQAVNASGNPGPGQGTGAQTGFTVPPGGNVSRYNPAGGVGDVDYVDLDGDGYPETKIPGDDDFPVCIMVDNPLPIGPPILPIPIPLPMLPPGPPIPFGPLR